MDFIGEIKDETLIICTDSVKDKIISLNKLLPIKMMNMATFLKKYLFDYDEKAIMYVANKYQVKYDIAKEYIDNLYYVKDTVYNEEKLAFLVSLKQELTSNQLLIFNDYFRNYVSRVKIIIYDIYLDHYLLDIFKVLDYQVIKRNYHEYKHMIYEFDDMEKEIHYVAKEISRLIDGGTDVSKIKLTNISDSYYDEIPRIFSLYNLKVNIPYQTKLISYPIVSEFLRAYQDNDNIEEILAKIDDNSLVYQTLVKVINRYLKYQDKELLCYKIKHSYLKSIPYDKGIDIVNYLDYLASDDEYIFMLGFNEGIIPNYYLDTDYLTDNLKEFVLLDNTSVKNKLLYERLKLILGDIKNLTITYKLSDYKRSYYPSNLVSLYEVKKPTNDDISYSALADKINLVSLYDEYFKYGHISPDLGLLRHNYQLKYNSFDNRFKGIDRVMDKLNLSYSKMQIYNKCAFRYYLSDILRIDTYTENFSGIIGSMVHYVMEKCLMNDDNDIDKYVKEYLGDRTFSKKENFFLTKYKESIQDLLNQVRLEKEYMLFNKALYEQRIDIDYGNNVHFVGIIDKVLYYIDDDTTYVSLIDYKTGSDDISLKYLEYGLNIQLPIYLYLSTHLDFNNVKYPGFYLQKFNILGKDYRLVGYSNSDVDTLKVIDKNYENSKIIKGLKTNQDGSFSRYSKLLSDEEIDNVIEKTKEQINFVIDKISNNQFDINPKVIDGVNIGCEYCQYQDICFKTSKDEVNLTLANNGGDNDGLY